MRNVIIALVSFGLFCSAANSEELSYQSFFSKKQNFDTDGTELYRSNYHLKQNKKFGIGLAMGGANGVLGIESQFNLDPGLALVLGMGTGPSYGTFNVQAKYSFEALYLSPYVKGGYSKWFNSGAVKSTATSSDILRQIYSDKDLKAGKFDANFVVASVGAEYNQLEGELAGVNFFGEMTLLAEMQKVKVAPSGAIGITYFY
ncbi:MAG: hypothetical protein K0R29_1872 [Pseudobdellovibrio sp.]|jgi:hypothetical protein|nr:hypothetical protein [Pseudobdellovibrio sp.]